jgi:beta-galactosidase
MPEVSRRNFMMIGSAAGTAALLPTPLRAIAMQSFSPKDGVLVSAKRLDSGWQYRRGPLSGVWEAWRTEEKDAWSPVSLPHCFNSQDACDPDQPYFRGQGWYRTRLSIANPFPGGRTVLHFQGAGQTSTLWVGSTLVGTHKGGYDEFVFDITDAVEALPPAQTTGGVQIAVLCDNAPDVDRVPSDLSDFCLYGGLYRHVNLAYLPKCGLDSVHVLPVAGPTGAARVTIKSRLYNPVPKLGDDKELCQMTTEVFDPQGASVHRSTVALKAWEGMQEMAAFDIEAPQRWSPDAPNLYRCRVSLSTSAGKTHLEERFGIRHTEFVEHGPFKLNGKRLLLRGTHRHADHAGLAAAMPDDLVRREMQLIREMGANFIRLGHYQQDRMVLDLCDELGLMVWEEAPWCRAGIGREGFQTNAREMLAHMIDQHINHPSIILWGLGNEDDWVGEFPRVDQAAIRDFMTGMRDLAHSLDSSRLTSFRRCDFARDIPDVYSPSIWAGWYRGNYREYEQSLLKERSQVKRFIHMEWGADSHAGRHSEDPEAILRKVAAGTGTDERGLDYLKTGGDVRVSRDGDWSETYACNLFDWHLKTQEKMEWLTGTAQWVFKDFASPLRSDASIPNMNQKGVVERDLTRKESYFVFQSYWTEKPMVHIYGHSWPVRGGRAGEERLVHVYSNCERAELFLNGRSLGTRRRDSQDFPAAGLRWSVVFAPGPNHLRVVANKAGAEVTDQLEMSYQIEHWGAPSELRLTERIRNGNIVTLEARLYDAKGVLCLDAREHVRFSVAGAGRLIDNLGIVRASRAVELCNGRAEISVERSGGCTVSITAAALPAGFINLI